MLMLWSEDGERGGQAGYHNDSTYDVNDYGMRSRLETASLLYMYNNAFHLKL